MKSYTNKNPQFSDSIMIIEEGVDVNHADTVNVATKQLLDNELVLEESTGNLEKNKVDKTTFSTLDSAVYNGVDLAVKHKDEIKNYSDVWAWLKARTVAADFSGLNIGDYVSFTANGNKVIAEIAGIDVYYDAYNGSVKHHIDFISRDCYPFTPGSAPTWASSNNNGTSEESCPYMVSNIKSWLNNTLYGYLPSALKNVITDKYNYLETRYSSSGQLTDSTGRSWKNMGKLWIPTEYEVYGSCVYGTRIYSEGFSVWYPLFQDGLRHRIKRNGDGGSRAPWWLASAYSGNTNNACNVDNNGSPDCYHVNSPYFCVPVCFRISA